MSDEQKAPTPVDAVLVRAFVGKAHGDLASVRKLLDEAPGLLHSAVDWGGGDWETALGAAAHMGRRDIAEFLLSRGARMDLFAAAMLNRVDIVSAMLEGEPSRARTTGPHGITLAQHAIAGKADAVLAHLHALGVL